MKKNFIITCLLLVVFLVAGCEKKESSNGDNNGVHSSFDSLYNELCRELSSKDKETAKYKDLFIKELSNEYFDNKTEEEIKDAMTVKDFDSKTCRHELLKTATDEELKTMEKQFNEEFKINYKFNSCSMAYIYADDDKLTNSIACDIDGKWYLYKL